MLSNHPMVRRALASLWTGTMTVSVREKVVRPNRSTGFEDVVKVSDAPCRLSFGQSPATTGDPAGVSQTVTLFYGTETTIPPGSLVEVTQHGVTKKYKRSGEEMTYTNHKECSLSLFERWA